MNTPSHAIINLALIAPDRAELTLPITLGAILPDLPMFWMYFWAKWVRQQSEAEIWTKTYYTAFWHNLTHCFHSIPLAVLGISIFTYLGWQYLQLMMLSSLLHCLGDFPVHRDDAHRHFLPFSNYRFLSPISYWDPQYHGRIVSLMEKLLVIMTTIYIFPMQESWLVKGLLLAVNGIYIYGYLYLRIFRRCQGELGM